MYSCVQLTTVSKITEQMIAPPPHIVRVHEPFYAVFRCGCTWSVDSHDSRHIPERAAMTVFVAYLSQHLLDGSQLQRAATRIQRVWRRFRVSQWLSTAMKRCAASIPAFRKLQRVVRSRCAVKRAAAFAAATTAAVLIQCSWRCAVARAARAHLARCAATATALHTSCAISIQRIARGFQARNQAGLRLAAATLITRAAKGCRVRKQLRLQREAAAATAAAVTLQSAFRRFVAQTRFAGARAAATTLASYWRCVTATRAFRHQRRRGGASAGASPPGGIALPRRPWRGGGVATPVPRCGGTVDFPAHPCRGRGVPGRIPPSALPLQ